MYPYNLFFLLCFLSIFQKVHSVVINLILTELQCGYRNTLCYSTMITNDKYSFQHAFEVFIYNGDIHVQIFFPIVTELTAS